MSPLSRGVLAFLFFSVATNIASCAYMVYRYVQMSNTMTYTNGYKDGYKEGYDGAIKDIISFGEREI